MRSFHCMAHRSVGGVSLETWSKLNLIMRSRFPFKMELNKHFNTQKKRMLKKDFAH